VSTAVDGPAGDAFVSTGEVPERDLVERLVREGHDRYRANRDGEVSQAYPALAGVSPDLFGVCVVGTAGTMFAAGDAEHEFTIMSVSKPFVFALVCELIGPDDARERLGVNSTGLPFNSLYAVERSIDGRTNPMVNAGAIATTSLAAGNGLEDRWRFIREGLSRFAGRELSLDPDVYASASVIDTGVCHYTLAVMLTAGLYESSGEWLYDVGLPAKSGIGGGIVTVSPGKGGMGTFAPRLDQEGNSVKGQLVARYLSSRLGMDLLISRPTGPRP
jgi:glutaminase